MNDNDIEMSDGASGIDRRDFMKKSALVGGMVWAAPMVSSIGSPAFAFTGIVIDQCNKFYRGVFEVDEFEVDNSVWADASGELGGPSTDPVECLPEGWDDGRTDVPATGSTISYIQCDGSQPVKAEVVYVDQGTTNVVPSTTGGAKKAVRFTLPDNCFTEGADAKAGSAVGQGDTLDCNEVLSQLGGQTLIVALESRDVSFATITFCCFCPEAA